MKKQLTILAACVLAGAAGADATCWRINPSPFATAKFKTVAEAMADDNVADGDTLMLDPGTHDYVDVTSRKNITVIGAGYFLDKNKQWGESQATNVGTATLGEGSKIEGCYAGTIYLSGGATASRCRVASLNSKGYGDIITQCYITYRFIISSHIMVRNNIILCCGVSGESVYNSYDCVFENNVIVADGGIGNSMMYRLVNSTIRNNIILNTGYSTVDVKPMSTKIFADCSNCVIQNNIFSTPEEYKDTAYPNNHYIGATVENTFVNEGSDDAKWQLLDTSAAKGAATHGGDCGAFGGPTPYVLSGIPMFQPHITEALVPAKPTDGKITVKLKIENQNE